MITPEIKQCLHCGVTYSLMDFTKNRKTLSGYGAHCKYCERIRSNAKRRKEPIKARNSQLKLNYGITGQVYDFLLKGQDYKCVICRKSPEENGKELSVDHDHVSGAVRGLLCHNCNTGLGMFGDELTSLQSAVRYLENR